MRQEKWDKLHKELDDALDSEFGLDEPCTFCEGKGKLVAPTTISGFKNCDCRVTFYKEETLEEAAEIDLTKLCYYDKRNPYFQIKEEYGYDKEEVEATGNFAKKDCACDNCFYGKSKLTEQLIWQQERMYSEEEVIKIIYQLHLEMQTDKDFTFMKVDEWFEQFKKK